MDNATIADSFSLLSKLMDIHGENSFKAKSYAIAAFNIERLPHQLNDTPREEIAGIKGIGESTGKKIVELLNTGKLSILEEIVLYTPPGVIEMMNIKGIGPKKIHSIWKEMGIESIGELQYACNENRLTLYKGFGEKTQQNVLEAINFYLQSQGHFLYAQLDEIFPMVNSYLQNLFGSTKVHVTGSYRRQETTIEELEFCVLETNEVIKPKFQTTQPPELLEETENSILYRLKNGLKLRLYTGATSMPTTLFRTTGSNSFLQAFERKFPKLEFDNTASGDRIIFEAAKMDYIEPCLRESETIIDKAIKHQLPELIKVSDIKSLIHSHSNWSDGTNTIEEMAKECIRRGWEYMVISDHSKTAGYANGLKEDRIKQQHDYIDELNERLKPFKIFKSIESDILNDGRLDYDDEVLKTFDLVIASIHNPLKMTEEKAMMRLLAAIENPFTNILGHMTGRLLLSRNGYPVDHKKIIEACAQHNVVIEINAHPRRLDIDWRWVDYAIEKGVLLSIDPDAHFLSGFDDVKYGVLAAQKGGLTKENNLSSFNLLSFEAWLTTNRKKRSI